MANNRPTKCSICDTSFSDSVKYVRDKGCSLCAEIMTEYRHRTRTWFVTPKDVARLPAKEKIKREIRIRRLQNEKSTDTRYVRNDPVRM